MAEKKSHVFEGIKTSAVIKNPVLFEAIGVAPVVAMAISLKSAIILSVVSIAELFIIEMLACLMLKKIKPCYRVAIYAVLGVLINIPFFMFFKRFAPNETANVGIFLPLMAVNSLVALHCERFAVKNNLSSTAVDAVSAGVSYAFVIIILGVIREIMGSGTIYSIDLDLPIKLDGLLMPFGGFLILGFFAAILKAIISKKYPDEHPDESFNLSEISQSHISSLKNIMDADFNPYDEEEMQIKKDNKSKPKVKRNKKQNKNKRSKKNEAEIDVNNTTAAVPLDSKRENYIDDFHEILNELSEYKSKKSEKEGDDE